MAVLNRIQVKGFKSIREMDLELRPINVLIGANGSGKSNFLAVLNLLNQIGDGGLQGYVARSGRASRLLHWHGRLRENELYVQARFDGYGYEARFSPTDEDSLVFTDERVDKSDFAFAKSLDGLDAGFSAETRLHLNIGRYQGEVVANVLASFKQLQVYHFNNTSDVTRQMMYSSNINNNARLKPDASNLVALLFLFSARYPTVYQRIVQTIQLAAPFFKDFDVRPDPQYPESVLLRWRQEDLDVDFSPTALSDGMLRFICLTTLLLQPEPPSVIIIDEPELGLHPYAETLFASMVKSVAASGHQVIISTQSAALVSEFKPEDVVVVEREENQSVFKRQSTKELEFWLEDYSLGEIWEKNVMGGTP